MIFPLLLAQNQAGSGQGIAGEEFHPGLLGLENGRWAVNTFSLAQKYFPFPVGWPFAAAA